MASKTLEKYLKGYAEPEISLLDSFPLERSYHNSVLIPAYLEEPSFLKRLDTGLPHSKGRVLVVVISNYPLGLSCENEQHALRMHQNLVSFLGKAIWKNHPLTLFARNNYEHNNFDVLLVNRTGGHAIPAEQGVGLARKIGADLIVALINSGSVLCPWIMSTDADTQIPNDYFSIEPDTDSSAVTYPFEHICENTNLGMATTIYEERIKLYVQGLALAKSDYAFSTMGSCLAFHSETYAHARGFPKRSGGEDFYLLNKLAKLGKIKADGCLPILKIQARVSDRVPFGTGPAVARLLKSPDMNKEAIFYNPEIFIILKQTLEAIRRRPKNLEDIGLNQIIINALVDLGIENAMDHANRQKLSHKQYDLHMKSWFDGFKTLKFIHYLRDLPDTEGNALYPSLSYQQIQTLR